MNPHCFGDVAHNISDTICFSLRGAVKHTQRSPLTSPGSWGPTVLWLAYSGFTGSSFKAQKSDPNHGHHLDLSWKLFSACTGFLGSFLDLACTFPGPGSLPLLPFCTRVTAGLVPEMRMMHALHTKAVPMVPHFRGCWGLSVSPNLTLVSRSDNSVTALSRPGPVPNPLVWKL